MPNQLKIKETSPDRTVVWTEPFNNRLKYISKVPIVYYLSSNGQLQHPHFIEVPLSTSDGLYLRDVINRLNLLRGEGMASRYSWSCKRSYKSGYVWNDLAENDFIHPVIGNEYVLKGSKLPEGEQISESNNILATQYGSDVDIPAIRRRRNQSFDMHECKVYKADQTGEALSKAFTDASTQTDDIRRRRRAVHVVGEEKEEEIHESHEIIPIIEVSKDEIPPPTSDSSPETLGKLMKADRRLMLGTGTAKSKGSVFMQLLSCGATASFDDCGPALISDYKTRLMPRGGWPNQVKGAKNVSIVEAVDRSLVDTKKTESPAPETSTSYHANS